jgi:ATP-dependent Clp protease ATP-binding subunit ClpA
MFERFTDRAREVVVFAQDEARGLKHNYIGTEHILLGLLREEEGLAARVLDSFDVTVADVRALVAQIVGQGNEVPTGQIPFTPRAKKVLELALREALALGHNYVGTEHLLLGLARENDGVAMRILLDVDVDSEKIRNELIRMLSGPDRRAFELRAEEAGVPLVPELQLEIEKVRARKEEAVDAGRFERAATLRDIERAMATAARRGDLAAFRRESRVPPAADRLLDPARPATKRLSVALAAVGLLLGTLVGWLIWG